MPEQCVLTGVVYDLRGIVAAEGTKLYVKKVEGVDFAHSSVRTDFVVNADGELETLDGDPASLPQGAYVTLQGTIQGFQHDTIVHIPEQAEYDFSLLVSGAPPTSTSVSQSVFNTHRASVLDHLDTPDSYTGQGGKLLRVNVGETGFEFINLDSVFATDAELLAAVTGIDLSAYQLRSEENQNNGYAGLDSSGLIPDVRIPSSIARDSEVTAAVVAEASARDAAISAAIADLDLGTLATVSPTGTPNGSKFLRDDNSWQTVTSGPTINASDGAVPYRSSSTAFSDSPLTVSGTSVGVNKSSGIGAQLHVQAGAAGTKGLVVQMAASPTASPLEVQDSAGQAVFAIGTAGQLQAKGAASNVDLTLVPQNSGDVVSGRTFRTNVGGQAFIAGNNNSDYKVGLSSTSGGEFRAGSGALVKWSNTANANDTSGLSLGWQAAGILAVGDGGSNALGKLNCAEYRIANSMVVTARKAGWTLPTSTKTRTNADYSTLTLAQLAEVVAALVNDVHSAGGAHGLLTT